MCIITRQFQGKKYLNGDIVKKLDAILVLRVIGDDCGSATWVCDAKHGEGSLRMLTPHETGLNEPKYT